jgi:hypothetical protein
MELGIRAFEVGLRHQCRAAVAGTGYVDHARVGLLDETVQMNVDEILARRRAPVSEQARLDVRGRERLAQQEIILQVDLADRQKVGGAPVGVEQSDGLCG